MTILGIESSCDETAAAIIQANKNDNKVTVLSNNIASSLSLHTKTGGIIPDVAAREQVKHIIPVIDKTIKESLLKIKDIDAIAVTYGPGLIGSLLVGVETAKTLAFIWQKPLIAVNHLYGHIYANWIKNINNKENIIFPAICLIVSGGHTDLVLMESHKKIKWLGGTKDDAAGEAFDKVGRLLDLPYPAGPLIEKLAGSVIEDIYNFPRPIINTYGFDFSFSGLKSAIFREVEKIKTNNGKLSQNYKKNISFALQTAIFDVLTKKTLLACKKFNAKSLLLGGGVAANQMLRENFELEIENWKLEIQFFVPEKRLCTDNAAMIASAAFFNYKEIPWQKLEANPELYFD